MTINKDREYTYQVGASLKFNHPTYCKREADTRLLEALRAGKYCHVFNSRQMGKSSLRVRAMQQLRNEGYVCAALDMTALGHADVNPEQWYLSAIAELARVFSIPTNTFNQVQWKQEQEDLAPIQKFRTFIQDILLEHSDRNIIIFLDEIDSVLGLDFAGDFFALIRLFYDRRSEEPNYERLTFCLLGVATPSDLIRDKERTPYNIGEAIELNGFTEDEVGPLESGLSRYVDRPHVIMRGILHWTGGQPFLTQKVCQLIARFSKSRHPNIRSLIYSHIIENWESKDNPEHLRTIRDRLLRNERRAVRLLSLYKRIFVAGEKITGISDSTERAELRLSGLVVKRGQILEVYNPIYRAVFDVAWADVEMEKLRPYAEKYNQWQQAQKLKDYRNFGHKYLLYGEEFREAWEWKGNKSLGPDDYEFLRESERFWDWARSYLPDGDNAEAVIAEILKWSGGSTLFDEAILKIIKEKHKFLPEVNEEKGWVDRIIRSRIIQKRKKCEDKTLSQHIKEAEECLLQKSDGERVLLRLYQTLLQQQSVAYRELNEQQRHLAQQLRELGAIVLTPEKAIEISNPIYEEVFSRKWIERHLPPDQNPANSRITKYMSRPPSLSTIATIVILFLVVWGTVLRNTSPKVSKIIPDVEISPERGSIAVPLSEHFVDKESSISQLSYDVSSSNPNAVTGQVNEETGVLSLEIGNPGVSEISVRVTDRGGRAASDTFTVRVNPVRCEIDESRSIDDQLEQIARIRQDLMQKNPNIGMLPECQQRETELLNQKYSEIVDRAIQLGREGRVVPDAIDLLCTIPAESSSIDRANVWLIRWLDDHYWRPLVQKEIRETETCPVASYSR